MMRAAVAVVVALSARSSCAVSAKCTAGSSDSNDIFPRSPPSITTTSVGITSSGAPPSALSPCASQCLNMLAANSACLIPNVACVCTHLLLRIQFRDCLLECPVPEWQSAVSMVESQCPGPPALSPCTAGCLDLVVTNSACHIQTNVTCMCTDTFQVQYTSCLWGDCFADERNTALALARSQCAAVSRSVAAAPSATEIAPSGVIDAPHSPAVSHALLASTTAAPIDVSPVSSIFPSRSPATPLTVVAGRSTTGPEKSFSSSSAITFSPMASPPVSIDPEHVLPPNSAAEIFPLSAADTYTSTSTSPTVSNGRCVSLRGMAMGLPLAALVMGGLGLL
ncbi:hypothetical protein DFH09DRAFT_1153050 [Mycena vulgaris]|nr:hypothetical protein DFH09DRAFT_1153050 [Mycena vulgaris]